MRTPLLLAGVLLAGACASAPVIDDPVAALALAEQHLAAGEVDPALALLMALDEEDFLEEDLARFKLRRATAQHATGQHWTAFRTIREFADDHGFSKHRPAVEDLEFRIGTSLMASDWSFLFLASDREDAQIVLEHFITRYHRHRRVADALRLLGEKAFAEQEWTLARERYSRLLTEHPDSEWVMLSRYRIAMAHYRALVGPHYDHQALLDASNELQQFVSRPVDNPRFRTDAAEALVVVTEWLGRKHVLIADFYARIGNDLGRRRHLERAAEDFAETEAGREAKNRLAAERGDGDGR